MEIKCLTESAENNNLYDFKKKFNDSHKNHKDDEGNTFLHIAASHNSDKIVDFLLNEKRMNPDLTNNEQETPLHISSLRGNLPITVNLIKAGANINLKDKYGMKPIDWSVYQANQETAAYLAQTGSNHVIPEAFNHSSNNIVTNSYINNSIWLSAISEDFQEEKSMSFNY